VRVDPSKIVERSDDPETKNVVTATGETLRARLTQAAHVCGGGRNF